MSQFSKWMIADIRPLLWIVTLGGFLLAFYCVYKGYTGALPWIGGMVGLPWAAHGVICTAYLSLCKSDHSEGGITFEAAKARQLQCAARAGGLHRQPGHLKRTPPSRPHGRGGGAFFVMGLRSVSRAGKISVLPFSNLATERR